MAAVCESTDVRLAGALLYLLPPAVAPAILALGSYGALCTLAGLCALAAAAAILPVRGVR